MWISSYKRKRTNSLSRLAFKFIRTRNSLLPPKLWGKNFNCLAMYTMLQVFTSFVGQEFHSCCSKVPRDVSQEAKDCYLDYVCWTNASERSVTGKYFERLWQLCTPILLRQRKTFLKNAERFCNTDSIKHAALLEKWGWWLLYCATQQKNTKKSWDAVMKC